jgi:hypothetical protein
MVDRCRPSRRAIPAGDSPAANPTAISSRSAIDKNRPAGATAARGRSPPVLASRRQAVLTDTPDPTAAAGYDSPCDRSSQNLSTAEASIRRPATTHHHADPATQEVAMTA